MKKSPAPLLLVLILVLSSVLGWRAAADPAPPGVRPEELLPSATDGATENPGDRIADRIAENARIVGALPGVRRIGAVNAPGAGAFQFVIDASPQAISRAFLVYELAGVPHWTATVRSINGLPAEGGFGAVASSGTALQMEEINPRWLRQGVNQVLFYPAPAGETAPSGMISLRQQDALDAGEIPYTVRNLRLVYLDGTVHQAPRLRLSHPLQGESDDAGTVLRGFVDPAGLPTGPAELFVDGVYVPDGIDPADGSFSVFVPRGAAQGAPWEAEIEVVYPDGSRLHRTVKLAGDTHRDDEDGDDSAELDADPGSAKSLALGKARLDLTPGALSGKVKLSLRGLRHEELPALDGGMTNVTPGQGGFRMGPHGLRFKKPVALRLPYDASLIPQGMTVEDVRTYFFDEEAGRWVPLPLAAEKAGGDVIVSLTDHFTDFINATLALPDEPAGVNYSPNSLQELAKADPAAEIIQIAPPEGGPTGDALLDFPLVVPPGRHGMEPELAVHYDSSGGDGWLGVGWDLRLPSIEVSTLFGVPRYDGSERYLIDGEQLVPTSAPGNFVRRVEGSFERIVRQGTGPDNYWWEVTDKDGTVSVFGKSAQARLSDPNPNRPRNTFRWYLEREIDLHGNTVNYTYATDSGSNGEPWSEIYPARIDYTGGPGTAAFYHVRFTLDDGSRPDRLSSGRPGFKTYTRHRLASVDVLAGDALVRRYLFQYQTGAFGKSLLQSVAVTGEDGAAELYRHRFAYFPGAAGFGDPVSWGSLKSDLRAAETAGTDDGGHAFVGLGDEVCANHAGVQTGGGGGSSSVANLFLDANGDGLPDRIASDGAVAYNRYDPVQGPGSGRFSANDPDFEGAATLESTRKSSFDLGPGAHLAAEQGVAGISWSWDHSNDDHAVADVDGDGLPDLIGDGSIRFNRDRSFQEGDEVTFSNGDLDLSVPGERADVLGHFNLSDPLRKLILPFDGTVKITGAMRRKDADAGRDGVRVEIYRNGGRIWQRTIGGGETAACTPADGNACGNGLTLQVSAKDRLYFLADSIARTDHDALLWVPRVTYTSAVVPGEGKDPKDVTGRQGELEEYGAPRFLFDAGVDFRLTSAQGATWTAPAKGVIHVRGSLLKQLPPAAVTIFLDRKSPFSPHPWLPVKTVTFKAEDAGRFDVDLGFFEVAQSDPIRFRLESSKPIDPNKAVWTPQVTYEGGTYCRKEGSTEICGTPDCRVDPVSSQVQCTLAGDPDGVKIPGDVVSQPAPVQLNVYPAIWSQASEVLSGGYHGWFYGEWNGNEAFNESALRPPTSKTDTRPYVAAQPALQGVEGFAGPAWKAAGFDLYLAAEGVKPSRQGRDAAGELDQADGAAGGGPGLVRKTTSATVGFNANAGLGAAVSCGASDTQLDLVDLNGDLYPDQVSGGTDLTTSLDSVPACANLTDVAQRKDGAVRLGDGRGGFAGKAAFEGLESPVRRTADASLGLNLGLGINVPRKDGKGNTKAVASAMPAVGETLAFSQTTTDLVDVNGDGLPDRVSMRPGAGDVKVRLNLGYRFGEEETWDLPRWEKDPESCQEPINLSTGSLAKLTSFGSLDALRHASTSMVNAGAAFGPVGAGLGTSLSRILVDLADVNGDGLPDHVARDQRGGFRVKLNYGDHWESEQTWSDHDWPAAVDQHLGLFKCLDALRSTGDVNDNVSAGAPICIPLTGFGIRIEISAQHSDTHGGGEISLEDFDGDGLADRVLKSGAHVYVKPNLAAKANLLATVIRPLGSTITLDYRRQGNRVDQAEDGHRIDMPSSQWVLAATVVTDGRGHEYRTAYEYFNDAFYDRTERESYGYARVRTTLPDGATIDRAFLNQDLYSRFLMSKEGVRDAAGSLFRVQTARYEQRPASGASRFPALVAETTSFYEGTTATEGNPPKSTGRTYEYDGRGNVVRTTDFADAGSEDDVTAAIAYQIDETTGLTRPTSLEVRDGAGRLLRGRQGTFNAAGDLARLERTLIGGRDPESGATYSGAKNAISTFSYDALGNLAASADPTGFTRNFIYDPTARTYPVEVRDSFGYVTRYGYDLEHGELTETVDENGNAVRRAYDGFGRLVRVAGPYDSDSAPTLAFEYGPGAPISWAVVHHKDATRSDPIDSAVFIDSLERVLQTKEDAELDLGSGTSTRTGMRVSGRIELDVKGRVASQGQPVFDTSPANQYVDVPAKNPTAFSYDVLDRVRAVQFPYGAVTRVDYGFGTLDGAGRFLTVRTDPNGRATRFYRDVQNNVLGVEQVNTIAGVRKTLVTRYAYDALDQLLAVVDAKGNATRLEYDTLGRNVTLDNPDLGRTESRYDPAGNLRVRITANLAAAGQQIRYLYTFDRLDRIDYPQSPDVVFTYGGPGAPFNRADRIATVADASGVEERSYGKLGEVVQTVKTATALNGNTPKGPYTTRFQLDSFGRLLSVVYPDGETLTYGFDAGGNVKSATGLLKGTRFDYLRHQGYDEFGAKARAVYGNGIETRYAYDAQSRFLTQLRTTGAGRDLQNLSYKYDPTGTVLGIQNDVPVPPPPLYGGPATQSFRYDDLYQLIAADGIYRGPPNKQSTYNLSLAYDETGNVTAKNQLHQIANGNGKPNPEKKTSYNWAYAYGGAHPHAPTHIGDRTFSYDLDGNQTGWTSDVNGTRRTLTWNEENRLASVADNGQTTRFLYDAEGTRTNKAGQHGETIYVNRWFSIRNGAIASKHVFADDARVSTKVSPDPNPPSEKVYFYTADHLGSAQFVTDESGAAYQHLEYFPSGETWVDERSETQRTPYLFSGKELDEETGLSYFGFRYYEARQGQWISADPVLDGMLGTVTLAKPDLSEAAFRLPGLTYGYAGNRPANLVDPTGLMPYGKAAKTSTARPTTPYSRGSVAPRSQKEIRFNYLRAQARKIRNQIRDAEVPVPNWKSKAISYAEVEIEGEAKRSLHAVSGNEDTLPGSPVPETRNFQTRKVDGYSREWDAEAKLFEDLSTTLNESSRGTVRLYSNWAVCGSCSEVVDQFKDMFPKVTVEIFTGLWDTN